MSDIDNIAALQTSVSGLTETNAEWSVLHYHEAYKKRFRGCKSSYCHSFSSSSQKIEGMYFKMGGTLATSLDRWTNRMQNAREGPT
jgi:hypothetical protein